MLLILTWVAVGIVIGAFVTFKLMTNGLEETSIEDHFGELRRKIDHDLAQYRLGEDAHPAVVNCLEAASEHLANADMAYYASLK